MSQTHTDISRQVDEVSNRYQALFAGQPRISRDARQLEQMVRDLEALRPKLGALASSEREALTTRIQEAIDLYRAEAAAIRTAQSAGPEAFAAHRLASWAYLGFARYRHHFAGQSRGSRDLNLLGELIADLEVLESDMKAQAKVLSTDELQEALRLTGEQLQLYHEERRAIAQLRTEGTQMELADRFAGLANAQFALYSTHFAGKPRLSRRPMLLERIIDSLSQIEERMRALEAQGHLDDRHLKNVEIVQGRLAAYRKELEEIQKVRSRTDFSSLINALGGAANKVFEEYRTHFAGQDRATRELPRMVSLFDALYDIGRQMDDLQQVRHDGTNQRNLQIVLDNLRMYDREHTAIQEAQQSEENSPVIP